MDVKKNNEKTSRPRGRPPKEASVVKELQEELSDQRNHAEDLPEKILSVQKEEAVDSTSIPINGPGPFSVLLGSLIKHDRREVLRIAGELGVSDNTVYRWLNGKAEPRSNHLQKLLEVLPQLQSTFPSSAQSAASGRMANTSQSGRWDVPKEIYRRVMEQAATTADEARRRWHIIETIFEYALLHLDPEHQGMALTYARLMPPRADGSIHSLYEAEMRGQDPWPFASDFKTYLGSTTLAGNAAIRQRVSTWSRKDEDVRTPIGLDENERSSCAAPVMRGGRMAGVLIVSSAQEDFVSNAAVPRAVGEYAYLLAAGLTDNDFYDTALIRLVPMPELNWQREKIAKSYLNRVVEYARKQCLSFAEAEQKVLQVLEEEFECYAGEQESEKELDSPWQSTRETEKRSF
jgi:transcriptional regulator with XRE-family HTH domain